MTEPWRSWSGGPRQVARLGRPLSRAEANLEGARVAAWHDAVPARSWRAGKARRRAVPRRLAIHPFAVGPASQLKNGLLGCRQFRTIIAARHAAWAGADVDQVAQELQRLCASSAIAGSK